MEVQRLEILIPVLALVGLTLSVVVVLGILRIGGITTGRLPEKYYGLFRENDDHEPDLVRAIARNYHNLLELPILFYAGCLVAFAADLVSQSLVSLAWAYVVLRVVHTAIHVSYNRLWHRMPVFVLSALVLIGFWVVIGRALLAQIQVRVA